MPGKKLQCEYCSKIMCSDNLKHHANSCRVKNSCAASSLEENKFAEQKRSVSADIATHDGMKVGSGKFELIKKSENSKVGKWNTVKT